MKISIYGDSPVRMFENVMRVNGFECLYNFNEADLVIRNPDIIFTGLEGISNDLISKLPNLKLIASNCTGLNHLPVYDMEERFSIS